MSDPYHTIHALAMFGGALAFILLALCTAVIRDEVRIIKEMDNEHNNSPD